MALRNRNPSEPRSADKLDNELVQRFFGMISGEPQTKIPKEYARVNYNIEDFGAYTRVRGGSKLYSSEPYGWKVQADPDTNRLSLVSGGNIPTSRLVRGYAVYFTGDDLPSPLVENTAYYFRDVTATQFTLHPSRSTSYTGAQTINITDAGSGDIWVHFGKINGVCDHDKAGKIIFHFGKMVFVANKAMTTFSRVLNLDAASSAEQNDPDGVSTIKPLGDEAILASLNGIYKVILSDSFYYMFRVNINVPSDIILDANKTSDNTYGYLYGYSASRISGSGNRDRLSDGVKLIFETGICKLDGQEKDYGERFYANPIGVSLANYHTVSTLKLPGESRGITHFSLYRSKNIGSEGVAVGNRRDKLIWVADIPVCKTFLLDTTTAGRLIISGDSTNKFVLGDVGCTVILNNVGPATPLITGWISETEVTCSGSVGTIGSSVAGQIGGSRGCKATQVGKIVTPAEGILTATDAGRIIFVSDGSIRHIDYIDDLSRAVVKEDGDFTDLAIGMQAATEYTTGYERNWNDTLPDNPQLNGTVSWDDREQYGTDLYIPRRFFDPIPNCDIVHIDSGFMVAAVRDSGQYYYCQIGDKEYCLGYYRNPEQSRRIVGAIRHIVGISSKAVFLCKGNTGVLSLSNSQNVGRIEVGENVFQLSEVTMLGGNIGVVAWKLIAYKGENIIYAITNDGALRYFDGISWSTDDFGFYRGLDAVSKKYLKRIDNGVTYGANYNKDGGLKIWAQRVVEGVHENICLKFATEVKEGYGWSVFGGDDWIQPMDELGIFQILDDNNNPRVVVIDRNDFNIYEIDTNSRIADTKRFPLDKEDVKDTEIEWYRISGDKISAIGEHKKLHHERSYVYIEPEYHENRGETGYTATGQRVAQELTLQAFLDGEQTTCDAQTENFPANGELVFSGRQVEANRISMKFIGTASQIRITGFLHEYLLKMGAPSVALRTMSEHTIQKELATGKVLHVCRGSTIKNRATNTDLGGGVISLITGPDGRSRSGISFSSNVICDNTAIAGAYTIIFWSANANLFQGLVGFTQQGTTVSGWKMYYKTGSGLAAALTMLAGQVFDARIYSKTIAAESISKLYDDTVNFAGKMLLPGF